MPTFDVSFKPILDPDDTSYALSPKSHDDPRNPQRQPKHRSHEDHKDDQEEQQQWLQCIKNSYAIAKEWMDKDKALWVESKLGWVMFIKEVDLSSPFGSGLGSILSLLEWHMSS